MDRKGNMSIDHQNILKKKIKIQIFNFCTSKTTKYFKTCKDKYETFFIDFQSQWQRWFLREPQNVSLFTIEILERTLTLNAFYLENFLRHYYCCCWCTFQSGYLISSMGIKTWHHTLFKCYVSWLQNQNQKYRH